MGLFFETRSNGSSTIYEPTLEAITTAITTEGEYQGINALRNSDVFTAVKILASDIASTNIKTSNGDARIEELLNNKPNDQMSGFSFKFAMVSNMLLNGNSYAVIEKDPGGNPTKLTLASPSQMRVFENSQNKNILVYQYTDNDGKVFELTSPEVLHFKYTTLDGLLGISPLYSLKTEISLQNSGNKTLLSFFKNGISGSGILKVKKSDLNTEAKRVIREQFEKANAGETNKLTTIVMDETMDYKPLEVNTEVLKLVNNNVYTTKQIAKAFGIPLERFGMEMTNTSSGESNSQYLNGTLIHYFTTITSELTNKLSDGKMTFEFDTALFEGTQQNLFETLTLGVKSSLLTINEGRAKLNLPPVDGGDVILVNQAYTSIDKLEGKEIEDIEE